MITVTKRDVFCVTLITKSFLDDIVETVPNIPLEGDQPWWVSNISSFAFTSLQMAVTSIFTTSNFSTYAELGIRPLLYLRNKDKFKNIVRGEKVLIGDIRGKQLFGTVVHECMVFCDSIVTMHNYQGDKEINTYLNSEKFCKLLFEGEI